MQLGITIPLQKFLKWKPPVYGEPENLFFCWDLHVIRFHGENTLMAVNASNAFTVILWKMEWADWENLEEKVREAIRKGLLTAGYGEAAVEAYFRAAGKAQFTKTHGRRPVAALNRMTDFLRAAPLRLEEDRQFQPAACRFVNGNVLKTAGAEEKGRPEAFLEVDMEKNGFTGAQAAGREGPAEPADAAHPSLAVPTRRPDPTVPTPRPTPAVPAQRPTPADAAASPNPASPYPCPCRRKCPRRGNCEECRAFHLEQKPGVPPVCEKKGRKKT